MTMRYSSLTLAFLLFAVHLFTTELPGEQVDSAGRDLFESKIRPALIQHCYECHSHTLQEPKGGFRLDSRQAMRAGGDSGPSLVPGDPEASLLMEALRHEGLEMPPDKKLPDDVIADFAHWISIGAPDPRDSAATPKTPASREVDWHQARQFWSFQQPRMHDPPNTTPGTWPVRKHDYFILNRLHQIGLAPSPPAEGATLLRRLSFDLTGLPPSARDRARFAQDPSDRTLNQLIDQWMASPRFGERWARMWLDLSRYAEDQAHIVGNNKELFFPNAYLYRDWVIGALNNDLPYDQFIRLQLAADLIAPDDPQSHVALGFIGLGPKYYDRRRLEVKAEEWEDRVDTVTRSMLGLTVACARCHDHKFDPVLTDDYYALAGVFASSEMFNRPLHDDTKRTENGQAENPNEAMHIVREGKPQDLHVFIRANVQTKGKKTPRGFLKVLGSTDRRTFSQGSGRLELADSIASPDNPLTSRVIVNRIWGQLMGRPIVGTPSNFGAQGQTPTHPLLLDDLAVRFMQNGWSLKWLIREIVTSSTYRQSSICSEHHRRVDPANLWLARMNRRRLDIEFWRDNLLACTNRLDARLGGPSIEPDDPRQTRRTVYARISRFKLNPMLSLFDFPDANVHAARRSQTTTPLQKLFVMNHPLLLSHSEALVDRLWLQPNVKLEARVESLHRWLFGRAATVDEQQLARDFLTAEAADRTAWVQYAQALVACNEMLFLD